jgi:hypothetical protein
MLLKLLTPALRALGRKPENILEPDSPVRPHPTARDRALLEQLD